jgi:hypothetical protein
MIATSGPRICHVTTVHPATDTRIFHRECLSLARAGYDVHLIATHPTSQVVRGVHIHRLPRPPGRLARMLIWPWLAYRMVRRLSPRPVICHLHDPELLPAAQALRRRGCRVIFDVHENVSDQILDKRYVPLWVRRLVSWAYRGVEGALLSGLATVHVLEAISRRYRPPKVVLRNLPGRPDDADGPARAPVSGPRRLVYVGEISRDCGALLMIEVVAELARRGVACTLRLIGPIHEAGLERTMRRAIALAGLQDAVRLTGRLPYEQAMAEIAAADVGLCLLAPMPNYLNSLPTKILEYMRAGVPVVASDFPCWRPYVTDTGAGVQAPPNEATSVADTIQRLLSDPAGMAQMGRRGRQAVATEFCWENEEPKLLAFYEMLLSGRYDDAAKPGGSRTPCSK